MRARTFWRRPEVGKVRTKEREGRIAAANSSGPSVPGMTWWVVWRSATGLMWPEVAMNVNVAMMRDVLMLPEVPVTFDFEMTCSVVQE